MTKLALLMLIAIVVAQGGIISEGSNSKSPGWIDPRTIPPPPPPPPPPPTTYEKILNLLDHLILPQKTRNFLMNLS